MIPCWLFFALGNPKKVLETRTDPSLIGSLSFAAKVVKPGRIFIGAWLIFQPVSKLSHHIYLDANARADISWWLEFLPSWNGVSILQSPLVPSSSLDLYTDASGLGLGGVFGPKWFSCQWPQNFHQYNINFKEIFAIFAALSTWGHLLANKQINFHCNNLNVVSIWLTGSCKNPDIMRVVRALFYTCANS